MKKIFVLLVLFCIAFDWAAAQELKVTMQKVFQSYKSLSPYLFDSKAFQDPANAASISAALKSINDNFHGVDALAAKYRDQAGFAASMKLVSGTLDDAGKRFKENRKEYALWRLRSITTACITCHSTHKVSNRFYAEGLDQTKLPSLKKAEFLLASRQVDAAEKALLGILADSGQGSDHFSALRRLMIVYTRLKPDPKTASDLLTGLTSQLSLGNDEKEQVARWIESFRAWSTKIIARRDSPRQIEEQMRLALSLSDPLIERVDEILLLRLSGELHSQLNEKLTKPEDRALALYLLGLAYSRLPFFFVDELPELYLEQCIEEFPGSQTAQRAYRLYKELVTLGFTGSSGTELPADVDLKLLDLYDRAYGIKKFEGKV